MIKTLSTIIILSISFNSQASEKFAGIYFDSSLPASQLRTMKDDLTYLYKNPITDFDPEFQTMAELPKVDGPQMYNWIYNRVKYIIGQDYQFSGRNLVKKTGHVFPATPLPPSISNRANALAGIIIMSNTGADLYLTGKRDNILSGIKLDGDSVFAPSPRVGILQVGEGLFLERLAVNKDQNSEANKIKRIGTIFHEARHSDGHANHIGFIHDECPPGHNMSGFEACDGSSNGSYSLEAVALKSLLLNCLTCSNEDKTKLSVDIADSFNRVVLRTHVKTEAQLKEEMETYQRVIDFYIGYIPQVSKEAAEPSIKELKRLQDLMKVCEAQLKELKTPLVPKILDPKPEGPYVEVPVETSSQLMNASIAK
ncbi:hypothetical protein SHI21_13415 [Bacteriovorax sp. PP10]|uniref:Uncharacterized protein n=1 Tax=Bacteriovorax antarcticus TaxID=3088717 RepID=A0ABU5VVZ8_9BACT|nr:hypothetical protein [Bacteriovorax sp. PP10]MEA9357217.1 hypothetical protein [Bacteriovorax sp. PP10]